MDVRLEPARESDRDVVDRLLELNAYEFSRIDGRPLHDDGTFGYPYLDAYWAELGRHPYLIRVDGELAGVVLVSERGDANSMSEFMVLPKFRRRRVGERAAAMAFTRHPGRWVVTQTHDNVEATQFWRKVIPIPFQETVSPDGVVTQTFRYG